MSERDLKRSPTHLRKSANMTRLEPLAWYYEEPAGICVVTAERLAYIPVRQIRAYLHRLDSKSLK